MWRSACWCLPRNPQCVPWVCGFQIECWSIWSAAAVNWFQLESLQVVQTQDTNLVQSLFRMTWPELQHLAKLRCRSWLRFECRVFMANCKRGWTATLLPSDPQNWDLRLHSKRRLTSRCLVSAGVWICKGTKCINMDSIWSQNGTSMIKHACTSCT